MAKTNNSAAAARASRRASEVQPEKVDWLWQERIPKGMLTVIAGKRDTGKGLFAAHLAADVSKRGGNVLYSAIEDSPEMITRPRLESAGANLKNVHLWRFWLPLQMEELAATVIDKNIDLVVIDPLNAHLSGGVSRFSDSIRNVLTPLSELAEATGAAVVIVEHALKRVSKNADPLDAIGGGSSGVVAASRMGYLFGTDPADYDRKLLCNVKSNLRARPAPLQFEVDSEELAIVGEMPSLVNQGECEFDAIRLVCESGDGKVGRKPDKRAEAAEWLTNYLYAAGKPVLSKTIAEDAKHHGLSSRTIRRAADDMNVVKNPPNGGRTCTWDLLDETRQAMAGLNQPDGGGADE